jgi:hypothetical protein
LIFKILKLELIILLQFSLFLQPDPHDSVILDPPIFTFCIQDPPIQAFALLFIMVLNTTQMDAISDREKFVTLALDGDETKPKIGYTRKNGNDKSIVYYCKHRRSKNCKAQLRYWLDEVTGFLKPVPQFIHKHTRACIVTNGGDPVDFDWEGKPEDDLAAFPSFHDLLGNDLSLKWKRKADTKQKD